jgi:hypothetical protein
VPLPSLMTECEGGFGLAACPALGLLVTSDVYDNTLSVWDLCGGDSDGVASGAGAGGPSAGGGPGGGLPVRLVCTLGGVGGSAREAPGPMAPCSSSSAGDQATWPSPLSIPPPPVAAAAAAVPQGRKNL